MSDLIIISIIAAIVLFIPAEIYRSGNKETALLWWIVLLVIILLVKN